MSQFHERQSIDIKLGQQLDSISDRYELIEIIGRGGMGTVYKARHVALGKIVALKVLEENLSNQSANDRFKVEAKAAASLDHPYLVSVSDYGTLPDGRPYMVMEYVNGQSLAELIQSHGALEVTEARRLFRQICEGLEHAHGLGLVHRDLKPGNIMLPVDKDGVRNAKIVDFGLAKHLNGSHQITKTGEIFGSPRYMSPEQCTGAPLDQRSDLYALGCVMYEVLTGSPAWEADNVIALVFKKLNEQPVSFSKRAPNLKIPSDLETITFRLLQREPEKRFSSAEQVGLALAGLNQSATRSRRNLSQIAHSIKYPLLFAVVIGLLCSVVLANIHYFRPLLLRAEIAQTEDEAAKSVFLNRLAEDQLATHDLAGAEESLKQSIAFMKAAGLETTMDYASAVESLASIYRQQLRPSEAQKLYDPALVDALTRQRLNLIGAGQFGLAVPIENMLIAYTSACLGDGAPQTAARKIDRYGDLMHQGSFDPALRGLQKIDSQYASVLKDDFTFAILHSHLAMCYRQLRLFESAQKEIDAAIAFMKSRPDLFTQPMIDAEYKTKRAIDYEIAHSNLPAR